jgi:hypothetical protein
LNARLQEHQYYARANSINPRLVVDEKQGMVTVAGGRKAIAGQDFVEEDPSPVFNEK